MMFWTDQYLSGWGWVAIVTSMVVFWGLMIALAVILVRGLRRSADAPPERRPSPEQLLGERFARGEIDEEEYRRRRAALTRSDGVAPTP